MKFTVKWQLWIYNEFDEIESIHDIESKVEDSSSANKTINNYIDKNYPDKSHGMFIPHLISIIDEKGNVEQYEKLHMIDEKGQIVETK